MATEIKLPRLGQGMESGTIVKWLKSEGDAVEKGEPLYELDTDKVTQEVEADASGVLLKIAISEGEVEVGKTIAVIGQQGEEVADEAPDAGAARSAEKRAEAPAHAPERKRGRARPGLGRRREPGRRAHQGFAARPAHRARAWRRAGRDPGDGTRRPDRRRGRRARCRVCARRSSSGRDCRQRRGRADPADVPPEDHRAPPDRSVDGARLPDLDVRRH